MGTFVSCLAGGSCIALLLEPHLLEVAGLIPWAAF